MTGFADWAEQLIAESTGKQGTGLLPVVVADDSAPRSRSRRTTSRSCTSRTTPRRPTSTPTRTSPARRLRHRGVRHRWAPRCCCGRSPPRSPAGCSGSTRSTSPTSRAPRRRPADARGGAGQPPPASRTGRRGPRPRRRLARRRRTLPEAVAALLGQVDGQQGYLAVMAYLDRLSRPTWPRCAARWRTGRRPVTFGWGPRFLHSTGQFHKGGPAEGVYLQITGEPAEDLDVPGKDYTFGRLIAAQAAGDARVLAEHDRPVLRLHLTDRTPGSPLGRRCARRCPRDPHQPAERPAGPAAAADRRAPRHGDLRRHRRPVPQEADAGDLRPGQPRAAAAGLLARRLRPPGLGRRGLRAGGARRGQAVRPHGVP